MMENNTSSFLTPFLSPNDSLPNSTSTPTLKPINLLGLIQNIGYIFCGILAFVCSFIVIYIIIKNKTLHTRDYYILGGLAGMLYNLRVLILGYQET